MHQPGDKKAPRFLVSIGKGYPYQGEEKNKGQFADGGAGPDGPCSEIKEAIAEFKNTLANDPRHTDAHYNLGKALAQQGMFDEAIIEFEKVVISKPRFTEAYFNLALAYSKTGNTDQAISVYQQALDINPNYGDVYINLGQLYYMKGAFDEAIDTYKRALPIKPNLAGGIHSNLSIVYFHNKNYPLAIKHCDKAIELGQKVNPQLLKELQPYR